MADIPKFKSRTFVSAGSSSSINAASQGFSALANAAKSFEDARDEFKRRSQLEEVPKKRAELVTMSTDFELQQDQFLEEGIVDGVTPQERFLEAKDQRIQDFRNDLTELQEQKLEVPISKLDNNARVQSSQIAAKFKARQATEFVSEYENNHAVLVEAGASSLDTIDEMSGDVAQGFREELDTNEEVAAEAAKNFSIKANLRLAEEHTKTPEGSLQLIQSDKNRDYENLLKDNKIDIETFDKIKNFVDTAKTNLMENVNNNIKISGDKKEFIKAQQGIKQLKELGLDEENPQKFGEIQDEFAIRGKEILEESKKQKVKNNASGLLANGDYSGLSTLATIGGESETVEKVVTSSFKEKLDQFKSGEGDQEEILGEILNDGIGAVSSGLDLPDFSNFLENIITTGADDDASINLAASVIESIDEGIKGNSGLQVKNLFKPNSQARKIFEMTRQGLDITPDRFKRIRDLITSSETRPELKRVENIEEKVQSFAGDLTEFSEAEVTRMIRNADINTVGGFFGAVAKSGATISTAAKNIFSLPAGVAVSRSGLLSGFTQAGEKVGKNNPQLVNDFMGAFRQAAEENPTADKSDLQNLAAQEISKVYGETFLGGTSRVLRLPPEKSIGLTLGEGLSNKEKAQTYIDGAASNISDIVNDKNTQLLLTDIDGNELKGEDIVEKAKNNDLVYMNNSGFEPLNNPDAFYKRKGNNVVPDIDREVGFINDDGKFVNVEIKRNGKIEPLIINDANIIDNHIMPQLRKQFGGGFEDLKEGFFDIGKINKQGPEPL